MFGGVRPPNLLPGMCPACKRTQLKRHCDRKITPEPCDLVFCVFCKGMGKQDGSRWIKKP